MIAASQGDKNQIASSQAAQKARTGEHSIAAAALSTAALLAKDALADTVLADGAQVDPTSLSNSSGAGGSPTSDSSADAPSLVAQAASSDASQSSSSGNSTSSASSASPLDVTTSQVLVRVGDVGVGVQPTATSTTGSVGMDYATPLDPSKPMAGEGTTAVTDSVVRPTTATTSADKLTMVSAAELASRGTTGSAAATPATVSTPAAHSLLATTGGSETVGAMAQAAAAPVLNKIALENEKQGTPESVWGLSGGPDQNIQGFATEISTNVGGTVDFKIATDSTHYRIEIYRLGYYGGDGARLVDTIDQNLASAQVQPHPIVDYSLGLIDCGNWSVSASWQIPSDATSGVYIAKLVREDGTDGDNYIPFIVRDDSSTSNIVFQTSDTTWEAYNAWGGASLYYGDVPTNPNDMISFLPPNCSCGLQAIGRAYAVSYNRPFITSNSPVGGVWDYVFGAEYPAIRWLEQNGYDVSYISGVDTARSGQLLLNHDAFLSVGHDEYWSGEQRDNVEAARDAGVNLAFWSGNEVYWKIRWENSTDGTNTPYRTMVCYKETYANSDIDPSATSTGTWRDPRFTDPGQEPENALTGTSFQVDSYRSDSITVPYDVSQFRFWRNTDVANLQPGESTQLVQNLLGYEWDADVDNGFRPDGLVDLSFSTISVDTYLYDYGSTVGPGEATHSLTMYRADSGALVFGAGTVFWSWGLDSDHEGTATPTDPNVQQAMVNMFADMGIQPTTLQASLVLATASTDTLKPVSSITSPVVGASFVEGQHVTIAGTAVDYGGGVVAGVEVSVDGGSTWHKANGQANWSYDWVVQASGTYTIESRAVDDSLNLETPSSSKQVTVALPNATTLFTLAATPATETVLDRDAVSLGIRFSSTISGDITAIRFYKDYYNASDHTVSLWTSDGTLLATADSTNESTSGWQTVTFSSPVHIAAGTTYVASYHTSGYYSETNGYFSGTYTNGPLSISTSVYQYGADGTFPSMTPLSTYAGVNYFIDVMMTTGVNTPPIAHDDSGFSIAQGGTLVLTSATLVANDNDPDEDILSVTGASNASHGTVTYNAQTKAVTFVADASYTGTAGFTYTISDGRGGTSSANVSLTVTPAGDDETLFPDTAGPSGAAQNENTPLELGVKFVSQAAGTITGIRFYKTSGDTGAHTASLWSSTGTLLATATYAGGSATGWQTISFTNPVSIAAGTTYVASYHTNGVYVADTNFFSADYTNGDLTAPSSASSGGNGVYAYNANSVFPTSTYQATNYWVDVVYDDTAGNQNHAPVATNDNVVATENQALAIAGSTLLANDTDADGDTLTITGVANATHGTAVLNTQTNVVTFTPTTGYTGAASFTYAIADGHGGTASATVAVNVQAPAQDQPPVAVADSGFSAAYNSPVAISAASLLANDSDPDGDTLTVTGVSGATHGAVALNTQTNVVTFTPTTGYTGAASFTYTISDGRGGTASANVALTVQPQATGSGLFAAGAAPTSGAQSDNSSVELGVKFVASSAGTISGIRYYKSAQDTGTHTASLWSTSGTLLGTATFSNETSSGWQTASFSSPIVISAGTTYVASYHSNGYYIADGGYFTSNVVNGSLTAPSSGSTGGNGVFAYGSSSLFPSATYNSSNYWVDVVYNQSTQNLPPVAQDDSGFSTVQGTALTIASSALLANDQDPEGQTLSITGVGSATHGTVAYDSQSKNVTFTPASGYTGDAGFTYTVSDGNGGTATANVDVSVTAPGGTPQSLMSSLTPGTITVQDNSSVELGTKFQADVAGQITAIRFYKGASNTGTHTGSLWTSTGTLLASATFTNETSSGWQTVQLSQPVSITAGTTYVASYHTSGNYSATSGFFDQALQSQDLLAPSGSSSGGNGVYSYGSGSLFPSSSYNSTNYYVDVVFKPQLAA